MPTGPDERTPWTLPCLKGNLQEHQAPITADHFPGFVIKKIGDQASVKS